MTQIRCDEISHRHDGEADRFSDEIDREREQRDDECGLLRREEKEEHGSAAEHRARFVEDRREPESLRAIDKSGRQRGALGADDAPKIAVDDDRLHDRDDEQREEQMHERAARERERRERERSQRHEELLAQERRLRFEKRKEPVVREQPREDERHVYPDDDEEPRLCGHGREFRRARIHGAERDERDRARESREPAPGLHPPVKCPARAELRSLGEIAREAAVCAGLEDQSREADHREHRAIFGEKRGRHRAHENDGCAECDEHTGEIDPPVCVQRGEDLRGTGHGYARRARHRAISARTRSASCGSE